jgi:hypothetical protein
MSGVAPLFSIGCFAYNIDNFFLPVVHAFEFECKNNVFGFTEDGVLFKHTLACHNEFDPQ